MSGYNAARSSTALALIVILKLDLFPGLKLLSCYQQQGIRELFGSTSAAPMIVSLVLMCHLSSVGKLYHVK